MQLKKYLGLHLLFTYAIGLVVLALLIAIFAISLLNISDIATVLSLLVYGMIIGLVSPGLFIVWALKNFFNFSFGLCFNIVIYFTTPMVPWIILKFLISENQKKWRVFVGLFILMYTLCGALYLLVQRYTDWVQLYHLSLNLRQMSEVSKYQP